MIYLTNTFSPMMLSNREFIMAIVERTILDAVKNELNLFEWTSAVSHEVTAKVLSVLLGKEVLFNRINLTLDYGDRVLCVIPKFRATESREFTEEEVRSAGYECFVVNVYQVSY